MLYSIGGSSVRNLLPYLVAKLGHCYYASSPFIFNGNGNTVKIFANFPVSGVFVHRHVFRSRFLIVKHGYHGISSNNGAKETRPELFSVAYGPDCELSDGPGQPSANVG